MYNNEERFGFRTKEIWVLKATEKDIRDIANLYRNLSPEEVKVLRIHFTEEMMYLWIKRQSSKSSGTQLTNQELQFCKEIWEKTIKKSKNDFWKDVFFVVRDKCKKIIGIIETRSEDGENVSVNIWIPNEYKRREFIQEIKESIIEWCIDEEKYYDICQMRLMNSVGDYYENIDITKSLQSWLYTY